MGMNSRQKTINQHIIEKKLQYTVLVKSRDFYEKKITRLLTLENDFEILENLFQSINE